MSETTAQVYERCIRKLMALGLSDEQFAQVVVMLAQVIDGNSISPALERIRENNRERAARRRAIMDVSMREWYGLRNEVFRRDGFTCAYCGDEDGPHHVDHVIPLSRGGASTLDNLVIACAACNASKRDKTPEEWGGRQ